MRTTRKNRRKERGRPVNCQLSVCRRNNGNQGDDLVLRAYLEYRENQDSQPGLTPSSGNKFGVTAVASICSGSPSPVRLKSHPARASNRSQSAQRLRASMMSVIASKWKGYYCVMDFYGPSTWYHR